MASRATIQRLEARINELTELANPAVVVAIFQGEDEVYAKRRHVALRPDHLGKRFRFENRSDKRSTAHELCAAHTQAELEDVINNIPKREIGVQYVSHVREDSAK